MVGVGGGRKWVVCACPLKGSGPTGNGERRKEEIGGGVVGRWGLVGGKEGARERESCGQVEWGVVVFFCFSVFFCLFAF